MDYQVKILQYNNKKNIVFQAKSKVLLNKSEDEVLDLVSNFLIDSYKLSQNSKKRGVKSLSLFKVRVSYPLNLTITDYENEMEVNLSLQDYKHFLYEFDKEGLTRLIKTELEDLKEPNFFNEITNKKNCVYIVFGKSKHDNEEFLTFDNKTIQNEISDFEVFSICRGLTDKYLQRLSREYFEGKVISDKNLFEARKMANESIRKYGKEHLEYLIELPSMPFKADNINNLFCEIERNRIRNGNPELTITLKSKDSLDDIQISYFSVKTRNLIKVIDKSTSNEICLIDKKGILVPSETNKRILPILRLLLKTSNEIGEKVLYYGHKTGKCYLCERTLTDLESVKIGLGPICRRLI